MTLSRSILLSLAAVLPVALLCGALIAWPALREVVASLVAMGSWVLAVVSWVKWRIARDDLRAERMLSIQRLDDKLRAEKRVAEADRQAFARGRLSAKHEVGL